MFPATESNNVGACTKRKLAFTFVDICIVGLGKYVTQRKFEKLLLIHFRERLYRCLLTLELCYS